MTYNDLVVSVSEILDNDKIIKKNLTIKYTLSKNDYVNLSQELHLINGGDSTNFNLVDELIIKMDTIKIVIENENISKRNR